jgi:hypothetical protein
MQLKTKSSVILFMILLMLLGTCWTGVQSTTDSPSQQQGERIINGQILFAPFYTTKTYLIDRNGTVNHTWQSAYEPDAEAYWLGNGTILRPIISGGGGVQKILWDSTVAWEYHYNVAGCTCHHDIKYLPNGNVLLIVWETKTKNQAIQAGRNPNTIQGNTFTPDKIIEVEPTGPSSGEVVWEWYVWDHLIQDYDASKDNYGVVEDHPELVDINFGEAFVGDWLHTNAIDYNETFDQILIDIHNFDEVWVIDHSTTTEEAAGHTGGHYGHGGDLLYRWGNPEAYGRGTNNDQKLFFQHGATWIPSGYPGAGHILIFDNGNNRPGGASSTVDEFAPPIDANGNYYLAPGEAYGPDDYTWRWVPSPPFYSVVFGSALRLKDGNTLVCGGANGKFYEVTPDNTVIWQWTNPYPTQTQNHVFKIEYLPPEEPPAPPVYHIPNLDCTGSLSWSNIKPGATVHGSFQVQNIGDNDSLLNWTVNNTITWGTWSFSPTTGENLTPPQGPVTVQVYLTAPEEKNAAFQGNLTLQNINNASDVATIPVTLTTVASTDLSTMNPFLLWMRHWLSFLADVLERITLGSFLRPLFG